MGRRGEDGSTAGRQRQARRHDDQEGHLALCTRPQPVSDATKLAESEFSTEKAIIIYGFDYPNQAIDPLIEAFELLADRKVQLGPRCEVNLGALVHPVHASGRVFGWRIGPPR